MTHSHVVVARRYSGTTFRLTAPVAFKALRVADKQTDHRGASNGR